jgi:hypothetical protein
MRKYDGRKTEIQKGWKKWKFESTRRWLEGYETKQKTQRK